MIGKHEITSRPGRGKEYRARPRNFSVKVLPPKLEELLTISTRSSSYRYRRLRQ
jgi:hypothetical protein